jgi:hypothetical protein
MYSSNSNNNSRINTDNLSQKKHFEFDKILDKNEKILWSSKPDFWPFVLSSFPAIIFGLFWLGMIIPFSLVFFSGFGFMGDLPENANYTVNGEPVSRDEFASFTSPMMFFLPLFFLPFYLIGLAMISSPLWQILAYRKAAYMVTDKRILISKGIIGTDFKLLDYDQIQNIEVNVGITDKFFSTGSISIFTGEVVRTKNSYRNQKDWLVGLNNPYEVFKMIKKTSHDIKTDIEYPNDYRPKENLGYQTEYKSR